MVTVLGIKLIFFQKCLQHILQQVQIFSLLPDAFQVFLEFVCNYVFLRTAIRENGIPFFLTLEVPNEKTMHAIEEGKRIAHDSSVKGYTSMDKLKSALDV